MSAPSGRRLGAPIATVAALAITGALAGVVGRAEAAVISVTPASDFSTMPAAIAFGGASYSFSAIPGALPGNPPAAVATGGSGMVSSFGGGVADFGAGATIDGTGLFGFSSFAGPTTIPYSAADDFIGLAFALADGLHYGYAEVDGTTLVKYGYETLPGIGITTGVPEPATLALLGLGLAGILSTRRRRPQATSSVA